MFEEDCLADSLALSFFYPYLVASVMFPRCSQIVSCLGVGGPSFTFAGHNVYLDGTAEDRKGLGIVVVLAVHVRECGD